MADENQTQNDAKPVVKYFSYENILYLLGQIAERLRQGHIGE